AGMQPRRAQILDLIEWYERQLSRLQVDIRYGHYMEAEDVEREGADHIVVATGSLPPESPFQRALPQFDAIPGGGMAPSADSGSRRGARARQRVVCLGDGGNATACAPAWRLPADGHAVTLVRPDALVAKELQRIAADMPLRRALVRLGVRFIT